jgi:hypothetical protein
MLARQALFHTPALLLWLFWDWDLCFCLGLFWTTILFMPSSVVGITGTCHYTAYLLRWYVSNFCPGWPWTTILLISASRVAGITDVSHHAWTTCCFWDRVKLPLIGLASISQVAGIIFVPPCLAWRVLHQRKLFNCNSVFLRSNLQGPWGPVAQVSMR